jgi:hypothetical protein
MALYTSLLVTLKVATDSGLEKLLLHRDRETITDTYDESVQGVVDIAAASTFTVPMTHLTEGQFLYVETTGTLQLHFSAGADDVTIKPLAVGTKVRYIAERASFTSLTIENDDALVAVNGVLFMVLGT